VTTTIRRIDDLPAPDRVDAMRTWFDEGAVPVQLHVDQDLGFTGRIASGMLGPLPVSEVLVAGAAASLVRKPSHRQPVPDLLLVNITDTRVDEVHQLDRRTSLQRGDVVLTSTRHDLLARQQDASHRYSLVVPYEAVGISASRIDEMLARPLAQNSPLAASTWSFLLRAVQTATESPSPALGRLSGAAVSMLTALLFTESGDDSGAREPLATTLVPRVIEYLRLHLADPGLSADRVARDHGVSKRYLYLLLEREGVALGDWVRSHRAAFAAELLADPRNSAPISSIAHRVGFIDEAHFARTFRRWYGMTPRDWRSAHHRDE